MNVHPDVALLEDSPNIESPFASQANISEATTQAFLKRLDAVILDGWKRIQGDRFFAHVATHGMARPLYQLLMVQMYHYTKWNSINQAVAAGRVPPERMAVLKFVYRHAREELGHENFVLHDMKALGLLDRALIEAPPLPATQAFVGYLNNVCRELGAIPRLGYSAWAESSYDHVDLIMKAVRNDLKLSDAQMTFMVAHHRIDIEHARQVRDVLEKDIHDPKEQEGVIETARTTLYLLGAILDNVLEAYLEQTPKAAEA